MDRKSIALMEAYNCIQRCMTFFAKTLRPGKERELLILESIFDDLLEWNRRYGEAVKNLEEEAE